MIKKPLKGIVAAAITPVLDNNQIDSIRLAGFCKTLLSEGCSYVSTFGTTGEGASFSTRQKLSALETMAQNGVDMAQQIPAIITASFDDAGQMMSGIAALNCRAALVLPPFYYSGISDEGVVDYFEAVIEAAEDPNIDILLYNIPLFSSVLFTPELVAKLLHRFGSKIVGIKDSTGVMADTIHLAKTFPELAVFTGDDRVMPALVEAGGAGMIGGLPNIFARDLNALYGAPSGPESGKLKAVAAKRIEAVDSLGGLLAIKAAIAAKTKDPEWRRAAPPLIGLSLEQQNSIVLKIEL